MLAVPYLLCGIGSDEHRNYFITGSYDDIKNYLSATNMGDSGTWGTDVRREMCACTSSS